MPAEIRYLFWLGRVHTTDSSIVLNAGTTGINEMPSNQVTLFPEEPIRTVTGRLDLNELDWICTQEPDTDFLDSVARFGVLMPILVRRIMMNPREPRWRVVAGRRRCEAAKRAGLREVPVIVLQDELHEHGLAALSVIENSHRAPNPIGDLGAIERMIQAGAGPTQIADELGLSLSQVRQRMRLAGLTDAMKRCVQDGLLSIHLANQVARWSPEMQDRLSSFVQRLGFVRFTAAHLRAVQDAAREVRYSEETEEMFSEPTMGAAVVVGSGIFEQEGYEIVMWRNERWVPQRILDLAVRAERPNEVTVTVESYSGWGGVLNLLNELDRIMPVEPNDDSDAFFAAMHEMRERVGRRLNR